MKPNDNRKNLSLFFVHGMWHGAWCWERLITYLVSVEFDARRIKALDLRGHGERQREEKIRWLILEGFLDDVVRAAQALPPPVILIGHSMGATLIAMAMAQLRPAAVVLLAPASRRSAWGATLRFAARHLGLFLWGNVRADSYQMVATPKLRREMLFSAAFPESELRALPFQRDSYRAALQLLVLSSPYRPWNVPVLVLGGLDDRAVSPCALCSTAAKIGAEVSLFPHTAHDLMLDVPWPSVAERMVEWLDKRAIDQA